MILAWPLPHALVQAISRMDKNQSVLSGMKQILPLCPQQQ
jgi:hypothetical protein